MITAAVRLRCTSHGSHGSANFMNSVAGTSPELPCQVFTAVDNETGSDDQASGPPSSPMSRLYHGESVYQGQRCHVGTPRATLTGLPAPNRNHVQQIRSGVGTKDMLWESLISRGAWLQTRLLRHFKRHQVNTSAGCMQVLEYRNRHRCGPTWIAVHGFTGAGIGWAPLLERLDDVCARILVVDLPGHGASPLAPGQRLSQDLMLTGLAEAIHHFLQPGERIVFLANSMGGFGAVLLCDQTVGQVVSNVLISPAGAPPTSEDDIKHVHYVLGELSQTNPGEVVRMLCPRLSRGQRGLFKKALPAHLRQPRYQDLLSQYHNARFLTGEQVRRLPPTLVLLGGQDGVLPPSTAQFWCQNLPPDSVFVRPESWGHVPFVDQPDAVFDTIMAFCTSHPDALVDNTATPCQNDGYASTSAPRQTC